MNASDVDVLAAGREAFAARRWSEAVRLLSASEAQSPLSPEDYESLTTARFLVSPDQTAARIMGDASQVLLERGDPARAARAAFWAGTTLRRHGEYAAGSGWTARASSLLTEAGLGDCIERGYLALSGIHSAIINGDPQSALQLIQDAAAVGQRFGNSDLLTLVRQLEGRARVLQGDLDGGLAILDEAMVTATTTNLSPLVAGLLFCNTLATAHELHDFGRSREWGAAIEVWCERQPDLQMYRGECQVLHAHALQVAGDWPRAEEQLTAACDAFLRPPSHPAAGRALYEQAELFRLTGRHAEAEAGFSRAAALGQGTQPGQAWLRFAQGDVEAADAGIRRALAETADPLARADLLPAFVQISLARGGIEEARAAASELAEISRRIGTEFLQGLTAHADGAVLLASGEPGRALPRLRRAHAAWQQVDAAYNLARTRLLIGEACLALGDVDAAKVEVYGARDTFRRLGAAPDLAACEHLLGSPRERPLGLTQREFELLSLLATGQTNREIASRLSISEKTVARHVSNIFDKLGVSSRAAATAFALKHRLV